MVYQDKQGVLQKQSTTSFYISNSEQLLNAYSTLGNI